MSINKDKFLTSFSVDFVKQKIHVPKPLVVPDLAGCATFCADYIPKGVYKCSKTLAFGRKGFYVYSFDGSILWNEQGDVFFSLFVFNREIINLFGQEINIHNTWLSNPIVDDSGVVLFLDDEMIKDKESGALIKLDCQEEDEGVYEYFYPKWYCKLCLKWVDKHDHDSDGAHIHRLCQRFGIDDINFDSVYDQEDDIT